LKPGEWNDLEAAVRGNHIVVRLNGVQVTDYNDASPKFTDGVIGLQIHNRRWRENEMERYLYQGVVNLFPRAS